MGDRTWWRGVRLDSDHVAALQEAERLAGVTFQLTQGSWSTGVAASAGSHSGSGAADIAVYGWNRAQIDAAVRSLRRVGQAAWYRTKQQGFMPHIHTLTVADPRLSAVASRQVKSYFDGRNGLRGNGRDDGPRDWVGTTWATYLAARDQPAPTPPPAPDENEDDMKQWVVNLGPKTGFFITDFATFATPISDVKVLGEGLDHGAFVRFADGMELGDHWRTHLNRLRRS